FFRFTDTYAKMNGGKMWLAVDPPTADSSPQEGLLNVRDFSIKGEAALDRAVANGPNVNSQGVGFSGMRAEFTRQSGQMRVKDGVLRGPTIGATIEGNIDYPANQVRMSGTFVPLYGLNNMFGQIPIVGLFLGGGSNEGLIGITYEVVGTPGAPVLRVNPISAMAPGVFRKIFDFNTGKQNVPTDFSAPNN
ncbi:MAG: AsmA-like C-terminal domain-containing protein, partial [Pseudomonadota bacterium]